MVLLKYTSRHINNIPDKFSAEKHAGSYGDHGPVGATSVLHDVEGRADVAVAIVAAEVVHSLS